MSTRTGQTLQQFFDAMNAHFGPQHWWPGGSPFEIIVGAVLTQNTSWTNVEKAIARLLAAGAMDLHVIDAMDVDQLAALIQPAGYFNVKARRLKNLVRWMVQAYDGDIDAMRRAPLRAMRAALLEVNGIGPETADSILLYALNQPSFVVDAYTYRVAVRHGLICPPTDYDELQATFADHLAADATLFNEFHALLVRVGKDFCRPRARCNGCPLEPFPHDPEAK